MNNTTSKTTEQTTDHRMEQSTAQTTEQLTNALTPKNNQLRVLKQHFPHCFTKEGTFDLAKFQQEIISQQVGSDELADKVNFSKESYGIEWLGKSYARLLATDEATTLLKADTAHNALPEHANSQNLLLKGDNLEVLKHLSHAYYEQVKMIYIDPPYNTGSDGFVYADNRLFTAEQLEQLAGVSYEKAQQILTFTRSKSNSHSAWLTFMYPRLYIAKQLLRDDGVIFVSIDDNEVAQLKLLMDEVFGEENFVGKIVVQTNPRGRSLDKYIAKTFEYIVCFSKKIDGNCIYPIPKDEKALKEYNKEDAKGKFRLLELRNRNPVFNKDNRPNLYYPIYINPEDGTVSLHQSEIYSEKALPLNSKNEAGCWTWGQDKVTKETDTLFAKKVSTGTWRVYRKDYIPDTGATTKEKSLWLDKKINHENGKEEVGVLFNTSGNKIPFSFPKSTALVKKCIRIATSDKDDMVLDFFAGSGTTADAVMQLNAEDGGNRRFILVQLPEKIDPKKNKTAYDFVQNELGVAEPTIFDITKERLIRSANKIQTDNEQAKEPKDLGTQDMGFRVYETMPIWGDYELEVDEFSEQITLFDESKLTDTDVQALLTTWKTYDGSSLTQDCLEYALHGGEGKTADYTAYYVESQANQKLYLMHQGFTTAHLKDLLQKLDADPSFNPTSIVAFGYHFDSKNLRELSENINTFANKKSSEIDFVVRY